jgi:hypothetical protein
MNREKKQLVVIGVLVFLVISVGAFQFTRKEEAPVASEKKKSSAIKPEDAAKVAELKYPTLMPLQPKDPFETASFAAGPKMADVKIPVQPVAHPLNGPGQKALKALPTGDFVPDPNWKPQPGGVVTPVAPPEPVFGYTLIGITEGAHPTAVFDDVRRSSQFHVERSASSLTLRH